MLNQNNYSEQSEYKEQKEQPANDSSPQTQPKKTPSVRRIGTFTMGITLVLVGILLLVFLFHPFDPTPLLRFSPLLLVWKSSFNIFTTTGKTCATTFGEPSSAASSSSAR